LKSLLAPKGPDGVEQLSYYSTGVGTAFGERVRGGMFGYGLNDEIIRAYDAVSMFTVDHFDRSVVENQIELLAEGTDTNRL
jgi:uncharacterized protein (DUF2235 family)